MARLVSFYVDVVCRRRDLMSMVSVHHRNRHVIYFLYFAVQSLSRPLPWVMTLSRWSRVQVRVRSSRKQHLVHSWDFLRLPFHFCWFWPNSRFNWALPFQFCRLWYWGELQSERLRLLARSLAHPANCAGRRSDQRCTGESGRWGTLCRVWAPTLSFVCSRRVLV